MSFNYYRNVILDTTVSGTNTVYSEEIKISEFEYFSIFIYTSGTSPNLKITREYSFEESGNVWATQALNGEDILTDNLIVNGIWIVKDEHLIPAVKMRYKVTGNISNGSDTYIKMVLFSIRK